MKPPELHPISGIPEVKPGDDLGGLLLRAAAADGVRWEDGDILVVSQKVVSKAEGRLVDLADVQPSPYARALAQETGKDPRHMEVILRETRRLVRIDASRGILIAETHHGFVCANAGVDRSNVAGGETVSLLPLDPDASAEGLRATLGKATGRRIAVVITDTFGRPWRRGLVDVALGVAGLNPLADWRGHRDLHDYVLRATVEAVADELAAAAGLIKGKMEGLPAVIIRGLGISPGKGRGKDLLRDPTEDLFR